MITLWDDGEDIDDEFDLYINGEYWITSYLAPPENPTVTEVGFWYGDGYEYIDTYLYESYGTAGGTLGIMIEPYIDRVIAYRWNDNSQSREFLYDRYYSGIFADYFGSNILSGPGDGAKLDVYISMTYTEAMGQSTASLQITQDRNVIDTGRILERQGQFDRVRIAENNQMPDIPRRRAEKIIDHHRTRNQMKNQRRSKAIK
jgi:hypothetical protein